MNSTLINGISSNFPSIDDRAIHYGDGIFETILCYRQSDEPSAEPWKCYYWQQHYQRLKSSAEKLKMDCPDEALFLSDIKTLLNSEEQDALVQYSSGHTPSNQNSSDQSCVIKIILSRGNGERGYSFPARVSINRIVIRAPLAADYSSLLSETLSSGELTVCVQQASINEQLAGLKHLNRLENVMARNEWQQNGYSGHYHKNNNFIEGLMLNADAFVIEGSMSNLFAVKGQQILTPALTRSGVNGVMRDLIIEIADSRGLGVDIRDITLPEIYEMDEMFITNSLIGLKSISRLSDSLTGRLRERVLPENTIATQLFDELLKTKKNYDTTL